MPKFYKVDNRPIVEAIQVTWTPDVKIGHGAWIIKHPDGSTTTCDDDWFQSHYVRAD